MLPSMTAGNPWRDVVIDALVVSCIYRREHETDPQKALADLVAWEKQVALDPAVSAEAQALILRGAADPGLARAIERQVAAGSADFQECVFGDLAPAANAA